MSARPVTPPVFPVSLLLSGRACLVVGGGRVATHKIGALLAAGADVTVVAPAVTAEIRSLPVRIIERPYRPGEVAGYRLAIACTGDPGVNRQVFGDGEASGVWVNSADDIANCAWTLPAVVRRGDLTVAVSTAGRSPAVASWLRRRLEADLDDRYEVLLDAVGDVRAEARAALGTSELPSWAAALDDPDLLRLAAVGRGDEIRRRLRRHLDLAAAS